MRDPSRPLRIIARQPVGVLSLDIGVQTIDALFGGLSLSHPPSQGSLQASQAFQAPPNPPPTTTSQASTPADHVVPLGFGGRQPIPIPPALAALPLFDTFFDLVEADIGGGIETPTPAPLLASVHELVQSITCSEFTQPETWALAHEWRETVRAAQAPHYGASPSSTPEKEVDVMYAVDLSLVSCALVSGGGDGNCPSGGSQAWRWRWREMVVSGGETRVRIRVMVVVSRWRWTKGENQGEHEDGAARARCRLLIGDKVPRSHAAAPTTASSLPPTHHRPVSHGLRTQVTDSKTDSRTPHNPDHKSRLSPLFLPAPTS